MARFRVDTGRFTAAIKDCIIIPEHGIHPEKPLLIYAHTNSSDATESLGAGGVALPTIRKRLAAVADKLGMTVLAFTAPNTVAGNGTWPTPSAGTGQARLKDAVTYGRTNGLGSGTVGTPLPYFLWGSSGGSITTLRNCGLNPTGILGQIATLVVPDLNAIVANNLGSMRSLANTAYGRSSGDTSAFPASTCPVHGFSDAVPKLLIHGQSDGYVVSSGHNAITEMGAGRGITWLNPVGAHDDASVSNVAEATYLDWLDALF